MEEHAGRLKEMLPQAYGGFVEIVIRALIPVTLGVPEPLAEKYRETSGMVPVPVRLDGLIDTGASETHVRVPAIESLGLQSLGPAAVLTSLGAGSGVKLRARITMLGNSWDINLTGLDLGGPRESKSPDLWIGRDVLDLCVIQWNGPGGTFAISMQG